MSDMFARSGSVNHAEVLWNIRNQSSVSILNKIIPGELSGSIVQE